MQLAGKDNGKHDGSNGSEALIVTSVAIEHTHAAASLCDRGGRVEAMKLDRRVIHTICVVRDDEPRPVHRVVSMRHLSGTAARIGATT